MALPEIGQKLTNPVTGVFGTGQVKIFASTGTFTVPIGISRCRARVWGAGGGAAGSGGGFAMKEIDLGSTATVAVTVGAGTTGYGGTSSFGAYISATGGEQLAGSTVGVGIGGDVNYSGGLVGTNCGGGAAGIFGNGGKGGGGYSGFNGNAGGGQGSTASTSSAHFGGNGFLGTGGSSNFYGRLPPTSGIDSGWGLDAISAGGGGADYQGGINGGGGGRYADGGFPAGGGGSGVGHGGDGLVIVEY